MKRLLKIFVSWNTVKSVNKKWEEYGTGIGLNTPGRPQILSGCARRTLVKQATETPVTPLKEKHYIQ